MAVPNTFSGSSGPIPLSQLDSNFATPITLGNTAIQLGNTVTTLNNMALANVTVQSVATPVIVSQGGTGLSSATANSVLLGNGTNSFQFVSPGSTGNVLTSNGTTWTSAANPASLTGQTDSATPFETSFGSGAGASNTGVRNTFVGFEAGKLNTSGYENSAFGYQALNINSTGYGNVALGAYAMAGNLVGNGNTAIGLNALFFLAAGNGNTAIGLSALQNPSSTSNNTAVGGSALQIVSTGSENTAIGVNAGYGTTTGSNITCVGYDARASSASVSDQITLGNASVTTLRCATTTITSLSDARDKKNVIDLAAGLDFVNALRPVAFDWHTRDEAKVDIPDTGFLAQDLQQVQSNLGVNIPGLVFDDNPEKLEVGYGKLLPVLVKAIQEQHALIVSLTARIAALESV